MASGDFLDMASSMDADIRRRGFRAEGMLGREDLAEVNSSRGGAMRPGTEEELLAVELGRGRDSFRWRGFDRVLLCLMLSKLEDVPWAAARDGESD